MVQLFDYGNAVFWIGLLLAICLSGCDFFFNNMERTFGKYKFYEFPKHPRIQKVCRILFLVTLILALFARVGVNWETRPHTFGDEFIRVMNVLLIYEVVCYACVVTFLWLATGVGKCLKMLFRFLFYGILWGGYEISRWINGK